LTINSDHAKAGAILPTQQEFYDQLKDDYDSMTGDATRWEKLRESLTRIVEGLGGKPRALDAGCGTGGLALLLASLGCVVTGVDVSEELLGIAKRKVESTGLTVEFMAGDLTNLPGLHANRFDLIICSGNTLPHLRQSVDLSAMFKDFTRIAAPNALLIVSWLNYIPILRDKHRLIGATEGDGKVFVRFYDFLPDNELGFNVMTLTHGSKNSSRTWQGDLITTRLTPWLADDIGMIMRQTGWDDLEIACDLARGDFDPETSKDVVYFAVRE
jgi:glycine/sarcosine N-methyltransferase